MGPHGCNCLLKPSLNTLDFFHSYHYCSGSAPVGWIGRLAFVPDQETADILIDTLMPKGRQHWIGLRAKGDYSEYLNMSEWCWVWKDGFTCVYPLDFISNTGFDMHGGTKDCVRIVYYYEYDRGAFSQHACSVQNANGIPLCEYVPGMTIEI